MHTPRFCGQDLSAGEPVLLRTVYLPLRTNCISVGILSPSPPDEVARPLRPPEPGAVAQARVRPPARGAHLHLRKTCAAYGGSASLSRPFRPAPGSGRR